MVELGYLGEHMRWRPRLRIQTHWRSALLAEAVRDPLVAHEVGGCVLGAGHLVMVALGVGYHVGVLWELGYAGERGERGGLTMVQMLQLSETTYVLGA